MRRAVLLSVVLLISDAQAAGWEEAGRLGARVAAQAARIAPTVAARARILAGLQTQGSAVTSSADLSILFDLGAKPTAEDVTGWHAGRRFTAGGPAAQLLVGTELYTDRASGPIGGKSFKLMLLGPNTPGVVPADLYDEPGTYLIDNVKVLIGERSDDWSPLGFSASGAVWRKGAEDYELRKWGRYLICRHPDGTYSYYFRKVSPNSTSAAAALKTPKQAVLPLPGSNELSALFDAGTAPSEEALRGWFAGRRYVSNGPVAALLVGTELYDNPDAGPIDGATFKVVLFGPDRSGVVPVDLYDLGGSAMMNGVAWNLRELAPQWTTTRNSDGVLTAKGDRSYEIRQSGDFLVVRYPEGFGYFFKKIR